MTRCTAPIRRRRSPWLRALGLPGLVLLALLGQAEEPATHESAQIHVLTVEGAIGPASRDYVLRGIEAAEANGAELLVLRLDTPGGLDASMRDMIKKILNAEVPVATWVGPPGARAASAGTYMLYASHIAAMAPSTNLGAATPVQIGGAGGDSPADRAREALEGDDGADDAENGEDEATAPGPADATSRKVVEDAVAYIRGLAERHGRNADWAERAVRESVSLSASEALDLNVIDFIADDIPSLLEAVHGRELQVAGRMLTLETRNAVISEREPDWRNRFLSVLTNPTVAYLLMMIGIYGLILEGYNPGALVPGVIGGICLLLALYAFQILPVNYAGLALMLLGFALIAVELFVPSLGILGIGGVIAVVIGSIILMDSEVPGMGVNTGLIAAMGLASALVFLAIVYLAAKTFRRPRVSGREALIGHHAEAISRFSDGHGRVHLEGEDWSAASEFPIEPGQVVEIEAVDGLVLKVKPLE